MVRDAAWGEPNTASQAPEDHLHIGVWCRGGARCLGDRAPKAGPANPPPLVTGPWTHPQIMFDHTPVSHGYSKNGVRVSLMGTTAMAIDIPAIRVGITFDGSIFQVRLPYSHFSYNTEGQCGEQDVGLASRLATAASGDSAS